MIDFHTHILPKMDDGSRGTEESLRMLRKSHPREFPQWFLHHTTTRKKRRRKSS